MDDIISLYLVVAFFVIGLGIEFSFDKDQELKGIETNTLKIFFKNIYALFKGCTIFSSPERQTKYGSKHCDSEFNYWLKYDPCRPNRNNYREGARWFEKAANRGYAVAQYKLAECYLEGKGVYQDSNTAIKWFEKSAEQKYIPAYHKLSDIYIDGIGINQNPKLGYDWLHKAAFREDVKAQYRLGKCHYDGIGVTKNYDKAVRWFLLAAKQNSVEALKQLHYCYKFGYGVKQNYDKANACLSFNSITPYTKKELALIGHVFAGSVNAMSDLGDISYNEQTEEGFILAFFWYNMASHYGFTHAQYRLATLYYYGYGIEKSEKSAMYWFEKAAKHGHRSAINAIEKIRNTGYL